MCFTKFSLEKSQELLQTTLNFILSFSHLKSYHKNQVHGSHHAPSNIFHKSVIILIFHILHIKPESGLIFKNTSTLANLNLGTKF